MKVAVMSTNADGGGFQSLCCCFGHFEGISQHENMQRRVWLYLGVFLRRNLWRVGDSSNKRIKELSVQEVASPADKLTNDRHFEK
jgi:hypothetical protein